MGATTHNAINIAPSRQPAPDSNKNKRRKRKRVGSCKNWGSALVSVCATTPWTDKVLVIEANFVYQFASLLAVLGYFSEGKRVND